MLNGYVFNGPQGSGWYQDGVIVNHDIPGDDDRGYMTATQYGWSLGQKNPPHRMAFDAALLDLYRSLYPSMSCPIISCDLDHRRDYQFTGTGRLSELFANPVIRLKLLALADAYKQQCEQDRLKASNEKTPIELLNMAIDAKFKRHIHYHDPDDIERILKKG